MTLPDLFWSKVDKNGPVPGHRVDLGSCWLWTAAKNDGYGIFRWNEPRRLYRAHRLMFVEVHGEIGDGLELDHLCRNHRCVNPNHLEAVSHAENIRRGASSEHIRRVNHARREATHCKRGHPFDEANTKRPPSGGRQCRACRKVLRVTPV